MTLVDFGIVILLLMGAVCLVFGLLGTAYKLMTWARGRRRQLPPADDRPSGRRPALPLRRDTAEENRQQWETAFRRIQRDLEADKHWGRDLTGKRYNSAHAFLADEQSHRGSQR